MPDATTQPYQRGSPAVAKLSNYRSLQARLAIRNRPRSSRTAVVAKWCQVSQLKLLTFTPIAAFYLRTVIFIEDDRR
jgi:hypothetical protein